MPAGRYQNDREKWERSDNLVKLRRAASEDEIQHNKAITTNSWAGDEDAEKL